ncbi:unnamed protein product, partial [marine sediment metagenome]
MKVYEGLPAGDFETVPREIRREDHILTHTFIWKN